MSSPKLLFLAGSARTASLNKRLARVAANLAEELGATITVIDLADYQIPLYNGDLEASQGIPTDARRIRDLFVEHDGFCIASPEYNSGYSPLLKNVIDWISRPDGDVPGLVAFRGKTAQLLAASPGALGGLRGLVQLRMVLSNIGVLVMPDQLAVGGGDAAFGDNGRLRDDRLSQMLTAQLKQFIQVTGAVSA